MAKITQNLIHVTQGQFRVGTGAEDVLTAVLGSCVAVCLHDPLRRVGGMNHFLLPGSDPAAGSNVKYGAHSMEQLVNAILRGGASRSRLEAHVFGGANVVRGLSKIGESNAVFAQDFIRREGFVLRKADTGGNSGRRVYFRPTNGATWVELLDPTGTDVQQSERIPQRPPKPACSVELF